MSNQVLSKNDLWVLRIDTYRSSGLTAREWCTQNNISMSTLRYWIDKLIKNSIPVERQPLRSLQLDNHLKTQK